MKYIYIISFIFVQILTLIFANLNHSMLGLMLYPVSGLLIVLDKQVGIEKNKYFIVSYLLIALSVIIINFIILRIQ
ncbi:hypothetical protein JL36_08250 [Lactococcus cremoris]|nr:hypothetical protein JL36_08250 [Lactococcus cremoris]